MNNKVLKKLVIPVMTTALLVTGISTASAHTSNSNITNVRFTYNTNVTTRTNFSNAVRFNFSNNNTSLNGNYTTPWNSRIVIRNNNQSEAPVQETPQEQEVTPVEVPQEQEVTPVEVPQEQEVTPEVQVPSQEPAAPQVPTETENTNLTPGNTSNARHSLTQAEIQMVEYVNEARAAAGVQPLAIDVDLSYVARVKSQDMQNNNYFSHTSPTYGSPFDMMRNFGIQYRRAGENIAINSSVRGAHNAFMNSQGHRENILNPDFTHIGIGIENRHYTQMFITK